MRFVFPNFMHTRARHLSNARLSTSGAHRGGQRQPIVSHSVHVTISND